MKKAERIALLKSLIENVEIKRQDDLVQLFKSRGFDVTQATISRDIKELGFTKVTTENGNQRYVLSDIENSTLVNISRKYIKSISRQGNIIAFDVLPGTSMHVKNDFRLRFAAWIFSVLTDDDTVVVFAKSEEDAIKFYNEIKGVKRV